jgi:hypothetical protein
MGKLILNKTYGIAPNNVLNDIELSFKAKGLYTYIQSKPDGWDFSIERIGLQSKDGRESVAAGLKELENAGYLKRSPSVNNLGQFIGYDYTLYEHAQSVSGESKDDSAVDGKPADGEAVALSKKDSSKKDYSNKEIQNTGGEENFEQQDEYIPPPMPNTILSEMTNYYIKLNPQYKKIATPKVDNPAIRQIAERITGNKMFHLQPEIAMKKWRAFCSVVLTNEFYCQKPLKTICNNIQTFLQDIEKAENGHYTPPPSKNNSVQMQFIPQKVVLDGKKGYYINNGAPIRL